MLAGSHRNAWQDETGIGGRTNRNTQYKSSRPASSCVTDIKQINWEDAPDVTVELRNR